MGHGESLLPAPRRILRPTVESLDAHPHVKAILGPVIEGRATASHAYLFHGPPGCGRAEVAEALATALLDVGSDRGDTATRVAARSHPDLSWIRPEGANGEILVDDVRDIVGSVPMTPFEAKCRVFVIEGADRMNDSSANAFLKTLEEPPAHAHLILIADATTTVLPTILSRCQSVRFEPPTAAALAKRLEREGIAPDRAEQCARASGGDGTRARLLASENGLALQHAGQELARGALRGGAATARPWLEIISAASERGKAAFAEVEAGAEARLEFAAKSEKKRLQREAEERGKRASRRAESAAADLALFIAEAHLRDVHRAAVGAVDVLPPEQAAVLVSEAGGIRPSDLRHAIERIEQTRRALTLNVNRELAIESLAHQLDGALS
ncbi:MAG: AAA family ATPase [Actinobacteria bacterium]|nr:AAA family ATPase [Actinomycetota bacterium]